MREPTFACRKLEAGAGVVTDRPRCWLSEHITSAYQGATLSIPSNPHSSHRNAGAGHDALVAR